MSAELSDMTKEELIEILKTLHHKEFKNPLEDGPNILYLTLSKHFAHERRMRVDIDYIKTLSNFDIMLIIELYSSVQIANTSEVVSDEMIEKYASKSDSDSPLDLKLADAVDKLDIQTVQECLEKGANVNMFVDGTNTLLTVLLYKHWKSAEEKQCILDIAKLLIKNSISLTRAECTYRYILPQNVELLELLLDSGYHPDTLCNRFSFNITLLSRCMIYGRKNNPFLVDSIVELLLRKGASLHLCDNGGYDALFYAAELCEHYPHVLENILKEYSSDCLVDYQSSCGNISILFAVLINGRPGYIKTIIDILISKGANVNYFCEYDGNISCPLLLTLMSKEFSITETLLSNGAIITSSVIDTLNSLAAKENMYIESKDWILSYIQKNNIDIQSDVNHELSIYDRLNILPNDSSINIPCEKEPSLSDLPDILPNDVKRLILERKTHIERNKIEYNGMYGFVIEYDIPYINGRYHKEVFVKDINQYDSKELFNSNLAITTVNDDGKFETRLKVVNINEKSLAYIVEVLKAKFGAINICHKHLLSILITNSQDIMVDSYDNFINRKINRVVSLATKLCKMKKSDFNEEQYWQLQREKIVAFSDYLHKHACPESMMESFEQIKIESILFQDGIHIIDMELDTTSNDIDNPKWITKLIKVDM